MEKVPFTSEVKKMLCRDGLIALGGIVLGFKCQGAPRWMPDSEGRRCLEPLKLSLKPPLVLVSSNNNILRSLELFPGSRRPLPLPLFPPFQVFLPKEIAASHSGSVTRAYLTLYM